MLKVNEIRKICCEIEKRYEIHFLEIGIDKDHVHFLIQSVPMYSPTKIAKIVKSITARELFSRMPDLKEIFWKTEFWSKGYFISSVGKHGDESKLQNYVKNQGKKDYKKIHSAQLKLF